MITEEKYQEALSIIKLYEDEQIELENSKRMKLGYFIGKIPLCSGKNGTTRLINCLLAIVKEDYNDDKYGIEYLDEITHENIYRFRNMGKKTARDFFEFKKIILSHIIDAYDQEGFISQNAIKI